MSTLILVTCDSSAGHLKQEKRADRIQAFTHRLVTGPVPVDGCPKTFFQRQRGLFEADGVFHEPYWFERENLDGTNPQFEPIWSGLPEVCREHDRIELWVDPDPNAQLVMLQLLDWLGSLPDIVPRLWLKQSDSPLGQRYTGDWVLPPRPVEGVDLALARRAWSAFGAPTPEIWSDLRDDPDLDHLPGLHQAIERTLRELPNHTGLGATARRILTLTEKQEWWIEAERRGRDMSDHALSDEERSLSRLVGRVVQASEQVPLWYSEIEELICDLAAAPVPALFGVTEAHVEVELLQDSERHRRFQQSSVRLTELGHRILAGTTDWSEHNTVHRWIGGTRLTNENLWRWDEQSRQPTTTLTRC